MSKYTEQSWLYKTFVQVYIRYANNLMMTRKRYVIGLENLPAIGEHFFIASNHQNAANDPINIAFSLPRDRRIGFMTRADAFTLNATFTKLLRWLGLVPVFRAGWEGAEALEKNNDSFDEISTKILGGMPIVVFPEGTHAFGHYQLPLSTGIARMGFHVAKQSQWQEDVKIVPVAHHYEDFFNIQHDFMLTIGKPISLKEYYEEYQTKPYTVLRRVKRIVSESIQNMMLDEGAEDYEVKEYLRTTLLNEINLQGRSVPLPQRLAADKLFIEQLRNSPNYAEIIAQGQQLKAQEEALKIVDCDTLYAKRSVLAQSVLLALSALVDIVLLPLWILSLWPNLLCYRLPLVLMKTDPMFANTFRLILNVLLLYPLPTILTAILIGVLSPSWWYAIAYLVLAAPISLFCWYEWLHIRQTMARLRVLLHRKEVLGLNGLRSRIGALMGK